MRILLPTEDPACPDGRMLGKTACRGIRKVVFLVTAYFEGQRIQTPWELLRMEGLTGFQRAVLEETAQIPYGALRTYKQLARALGHPKACRPVGTALAKNPFPILIPCHRVIRSDHAIGGFGGGTPLKKWLIQHEAEASLAHEPLL